LVLYVGALALDLYGTERRGGKKESWMWALCGIGEEGLLKIGDLAVVDFRSHRSHKPKDQDGGSPAFLGPVPSTKRKHWHTAPSPGESKKAGVS